MVTMILTGQNVLPIQIEGGYMISLMQMSKNVEFKD